jgi:hypothetical protein
MAMFLSDGAFPNDTLRLWAGRGGKLKFGTAADLERLEMADVVSEPEQQQMEVDFHCHGHHHWQQHLR